VVGHKLTRRRELQRPLKSVSGGCRKVRGPRQLRQKTAECPGTSFLDVGERNVATHTLAIVGGQERAAGTDMPPPRGPRELCAKCDTAEPARKPQPAANAQPTRETTRAAARLITERSVRDAGSCRGTDLVVTAAGQPGRRAGRRRQHSCLWRAARPRVWPGGSGASKARTFAPALEAELVALPGAIRQRSNLPPDARFGGQIGPCR